MTELQQVLQKLSELDKKIDNKFTDLDKKTDLGFANINTKFAEIDTKFAGIDTKLATLEGKFDTKFATLEGKFDTKFATLEGKVDNLPERIKLIESSAGKIVELSEKVGEGRGWRQLVQPFLTTLVTLLIGGGINWMMGVYRIAK